MTPCILPPRTSYNTTVSLLHPLPFTTARKQIQTDRPLGDDGEISNPANQPPELYSDHTDDPSTESSVYHLYSILVRQSPQFRWKPGTSLLADETPELRSLHYSFVEMRLLPKKPIQFTKNHFPSTFTLDLTPAATLDLTPAWEEDWRGKLRSQGDLLVFVSFCFLCRPDYCRTS